MLHSVQSVRHDEVACPVAAGTTFARTQDSSYRPGLTSSWSSSSSKDVVLPAMDRTLYDCSYDRPPPTSFLTPPSLLQPPGIYHPTAGGVAELPYCPPPARLHDEVNACTPPYFERRFLAPEVLERATSGVYSGAGGGMSLSYRDAPQVKSEACCVSGCADRDCSMHHPSVLLANSDSLMRTPRSNLTPPPPPSLSMFTWRPGQSRCSSDQTNFAPTYFTNFVADQPSCHSPVGADGESLKLQSRNFVVLKLLLNVSI